MRLGYDDDGPDHDFIRVRCPECQRMYWSDDNGCPRCAVCAECGEPSVTEICEACDKPTDSEPSGE